MQICRCVVRNRKMYRTPVLTIVQRSLVWLCLVLCATLAALHTSVASSADDWGFPSLQPLSRATGADVLAVVKSQCSKEEWTSTVYVNGTPSSMSAMEPSTQAHELCHAVNSRLRTMARQQFGRAANGGFLVENNWYFIAPEPTAFRLSDVARAIPENERGQSYSLYLQQQLRDWDDSPLYMFDELTAYVAGFATCAERGERAVFNSDAANALDFANYCEVVISLIRERESHYPTESLASLEQCVRFCDNRIARIIMSAGQSGIDASTAAVRYRARYEKRYRDEPPQVAQTSYGCVQGASCGTQVIQSYVEETPYQKPDRVVQPPPMVTIDWQKIYREMLDRMAADQRFRGKDGLQGPPGESITGPAGGTGPEGPPPTDEQMQAAVEAWITSHPSEVAAMITPHLPPFFPQWIDKQGRIVDETPGGVRLGYTLPLRIEGFFKSADAKP